MSNLPTIERFDTKNGARIYRIPMMVFPNNFIGFSHLLLDAGPPTLVDAGSGFGDSNNDLLKGLEAVRTDFGEKVALTDIKRIVVTHGHIDHFGGVAFMKGQTGAEVGIHQLDRRVLTKYEERVVMTTKALKLYLQKSGVPDDEKAEMLSMYGFVKQFSRAVHVDFSLEEDKKLGGMNFIHVPGHCPGQVCVLVDNVLLSADHILSEITPHQAPENITSYTGLGHYKESLHKVAQIPGLDLALGGHQNPIHNVYERIDEIEKDHDRKLERVLDIIKNADSPCTIHKVTQTMYPNKSGYDILLALEEAGAHVEYLYQHGILSVCNLDEVEKEDNPALCYSVT